MGLESIFSLIPAIGPIIGPLLDSLFGEENDNAPLRKYTLRVGEQLTDEIDIVNDHGQLSLKNRTPHSLCVAFPAQNGNDPETIIVPSCNAMDLNDHFKNCAANDVDNFNITVVAKDESTKSLFAGENVLTVSAGGTVTVNADNDKFIGVYTSIHLTENDVTVKQLDGKGKGEVITLYLQSASGSGSFYAHEVTMGDENSVKIPHTLTLQTGQEVHVSVTLNYATANLAKYMEDNNKRYGVRRMSPEEINMLENTVAVNRRIK